MLLKVRPYSCVAAASVALYNITHTFEDRDPESQIILIHHSGESAGT